MQDREARGEEDEAVEQAVRRAEQDALAEAVEQRDLAEEQEEGAARRRRGRAEHGAADEREGLLDAGLGDVPEGLPDVERVVHREADEDDDHERLRGAELPAEQREHRRDDHGQRRRHGEDHCRGGPQRARRDAEDQQRRAQGERQRRQRAADDAGLELRLDPRPARVVDVASRVGDLRNALFDVAFSDLYLISTAYSSPTTSLKRR